MALICNVSARQNAMAAASAMKPMASARVISSGWMIGKAKNKPALKNNTITQAAKVSFLDMIISTIIIVSAKIRREDNECR